MKNYLLLLLVLLLVFVLIVIIVVGIYIEKNKSTTAPINPPAVTCPDYSVQKSKYIPGPLYQSISGVASEEDCQNRCTQNIATYNSGGDINATGCVWYNYDNATQTCDLGHGQVNPAVSTGFKTSPTSAKCPKWYTVKGMDITGYDNTNLPNYPYQVTGESGCQALCEQYNCDWYNYNHNSSPNCYLKSAVTNTTKNLGIPVGSSLNTTH